MVVEKHPQPTNSLTQRIVEAAKEYGNVTVKENSEFFLDMDKSHF